MVLIRLWAERDISYIAESIQHEGWRHTRNDVDRCWRYEPKGCFIAEVQGKLVGHVFSIRYGKTGWIGLLIVNPEERGKGVGKMLMQNAIAYLQEAGAETIRLEAVEKAIQLYSRLGFKEEFDSLRFRKKLKREDEPKINLRTGIRRIQREDFEDVSKFDSQYFGSGRRHVLQSLYEDNPQLCYIAKEDRKTRGFIMGRKTQAAHWIGPWISQDSETAEGLLNAFIDALEEETELRLGMPALNTEGVSLMRELNFELTGKSVRMVLGKQQHKGDLEGVYGIGGPEKG